MTTGAAPGAASARLAELLRSAADPPPPAGAAGAAVLILLRCDGANEEIEVLLIERSVRAGDPGSGQVGLPGGRFHRGDTTLRETALREAEEEVGIGPLDLAESPRYVATEHARAFGLEVAVFAAPLSPHGRAPGARSPEEVAGVFWLHSRRLSEVSRVPRETGRGPAEVDAAVFDGHVVWGFTRRILREFFGYQPRPTPENGSN